ncbi:MAG: OadG family protein [Saprospiraceae bacterium]|nr:OadG family protein [Saprospiraceae bacterium]
MENLTYGILISIVGYSVTLITLALLYYAFRFLPKLLHLQVRKRLRSLGHQVSPDEDLSVKADEAAAIAMALYLYFNELHDEESTRMTIRKIPKAYSPWSSKIFGMSHPIRR